MKARDIIQTIKDKQKKNAKEKKSIFIAELEI
jgi:hypothetical protein